MQSSDALCRALSAGSSTSAEVARSTSLREPLQQTQPPPRSWCRGARRGCSPLGFRSHSPSSHGSAGERRRQRVRETSLRSC